MGSARIEVNMYINPITGKESQIFCKKSSFCIKANCRLKYSLVHVLEECPFFEITKEYGFRNNNNEWKMSNSDREWW